MDPTNPWALPYQNPRTGGPIPDIRSITRVPRNPSNLSNSHSASAYPSTMPMAVQPSERTDGGPLMAMSRKNKRQKEEGYEDRERINRAAVILGSRELLVFHGMGSGETVPQTRLRFEKELCGIATDHEDDGAWVDVIEEDEDKGGKVGWGLDREERNGSGRKAMMGGSGATAKEKESERKGYRRSGSKS